MSRAKEIGPWRGPSEEEWVARINEGASRTPVPLTNGQIIAPQSGGEWAIPWIVPVPLSESELRLIYGDR